MQQQQQGSNNGSSSSSSPRQMGDKTAPTAVQARMLRDISPLPRHRITVIQPRPTTTKRKTCHYHLDCCILRVCGVQRWRCMRSRGVTNQTARPADFQDTRRTDRRVHHFSHSQPPSFLTSENVNAVVEHRRGVQRPLTRSAAVRRALHLRPSPDRRHGFRGGGSLASQA